MAANRNHLIPQLHDVNALSFPASPSLAWLLIMPSLPRDTSRCFPMTWSE